MKTVKQEMSLDKSTRTLTYTRRVKLTHQFQKRTDNDVYPLFLILLKAKEALTVPVLAQKLGKTTKETRLRIKSLDRMLSRKQEKWPLKLRTVRKKIALAGQKP